MLNANKVACTLIRVGACLLAPDFQIAMRLAQALQVPVASPYCDSDEMAQMVLAFH